MLSHIDFDILENSKTALADTLQTSIIDSMLHDENKDWDLQHSVSFSPEEIQMVFILFYLLYNILTGEKTDPWKWLVL